MTWKSFMMMNQPFGNPRVIIMKNNEGRMMDLDRTCATFIHHHAIYASAEQQCSSWTHKAS